LANNKNERGNGVTSITRMTPASRSYTMLNADCMHWKRTTTPISPGSTYS
jgi:hypothetical protein